MKNRIVENLTSYVETLHPIIYINNNDFDAIDDAIKKIDNNAERIEFNNALGKIDFDTKSPMNGPGKECDLEQFLMDVMDDGFNQKPTYIILKDIHNELNSAKIIALLKRIAHNYMNYDNYNEVIFIISAIKVIPKELEEYITLIDFPLPEEDDIIDILNSFSEEYDINIEKNVVDKIAMSLKGLNEFQINKILRLAYYDGGNITEKDKNLILKEKKQIIKKSGILELVNFDENIDSIGGLENLKEWLNWKAKIFKKLDKPELFMTA